jgi:integrase
MAIHKLRPRQIETAKSDGMLADGGGLYLQVRLGGRAKSWIFRYSVDGRERSMGLGSLDTVTLDEARERALQCRKQRLDGIDPIEARKAAQLDHKLAQAREVTFRKCAEDWMTTTQEITWTPKHAKTQRQRLADYIYPKLGNLPVQKLDLDHSRDAVHLIYEVLEPIWLTKHTTATKVQQLIEGALNWAYAKQYITSAAAASLKGPLGILLVKTSQFYEAKHHGSIPFQEIGKFMAKLRACVEVIGTEEFYNHELRARVRELHATGLFNHEQIAKQVGRARGRVSQILREPPRQESHERPAASYVAEFTTLTAVRVGQAREARWEDIDDERGVWVCKKHKTRKKTGADHIVPLSKQALYVLERMKQRHIERGPKSDYVFLSGSRKSINSHALISTSTVLRLIKELSGKEVTTHGMRTTFKTWAIEHNYDETDSEMALAHKIGDPVRNIYARFAQKIEPRRLMMQDFADYCDRTEPLPSAVISNIRDHLKHKKGEVS